MKALLALLCGVMVMSFAGAADVPPAGDRAVDELLGIWFGEGAPALNWRDTEITSEAPVDDELYGINAYEEADRWMPRHVYIRVCKNRMLVNEVERPLPEGAVAQLDALYERLLSEPGFAPLV